MEKPKLPVLHRQENRQQSLLKLKESIHRYVTMVSYFTSLKYALHKSCRIHQDHLLRATAADI